MTMKTINSMIVLIFIMMTPPALTQAAHLSHEALMSLQPYPNVKDES